MVVNEAISRTLFEESTKGISGRILEIRGWKVWVNSYPILEVSFVAEGRQELRIKMICDDWNDLPPSVELLSSDGTKLTSLTGVVAAGTQFHAGPHPVKGGPFICMVGTREYHTHGSHLSDLWENYRNNERYRLDSILTQIWNAWKKAKP